MEIYVGTSGWSYPWNPKRSMKWYVEQGFNAVELNYSFYRFPSSKQVETWSKYSLRWSVKVNKIITHVKRLTDVEAWRNFRKIMEPLRPDFYLFQMPPSFKASDENVRRVEQFAKEIQDRMVIEFRDPEWFSLDVGVNVVSLDSPIGIFLIRGKIIYLRMHGRGKVWYDYHYGKKEMEEDLEKLIEMKPQVIYVFFNNTNMLQDALTFRELVKEKVGDARK
ncbi:DUF72 domain-containing protein [Sulfuracidifex metallicus]|uniref:DUF72 domain-containing protein n=1 Tax=Sulfuracidifex metallicus DSM 6482 = JCM 9184 TaxID=523847 RepID=A0A6A9QPX6_SULME|nr:DUF72 domain-containing protein [Sulfuracidifex metallicus]MUN29808.1 DUF72 domain-containing protein [Sulfuracidifex metallicus DSM 6482 = JCM 9184]WOE51806.1 DUF72 domain-containing protein [Sulfuracidifex metallicus DSM 6482 = JCM 9184]